MKEVGTTKARFGEKKIAPELLNSSKWLVAPSCSHPPGLLVQSCQADRVFSETILGPLKMADDLLFQHHLAAKDVSVQLVEECWLWSNGADFRKGIPASLVQMNNQNKVDPLMQMFWK